MDKNIHHIIETYLGGNMSPEDQAKFEEMLSKDPELQKEVELSNAINHHFREETWLATKNEVTSKAKSDIEKFIKSEEASEIKSKIKQARNSYKESKNQFSKVKYLISSIAAILVIGLLATSLFFNQNDTSDLYAAYYSSNDLPSLIKRGATANTLQIALEQFKNKKFNEAIDTFDTYKETNTIKNPLLYAYIGMSHLELDQHKEALDNFNLLINSNSLDNTRGLWYKSLVYLKTNDIPNLKTTLSIIKENSTNFNYGKAIKLLNEIE